MNSWNVPARFRNCISADGTKVSLASSLLDTLPEWLKNLTGLTTLNLSSNELTSLPEWIGNLTELTELRVYGNQLTSLPESIGNLTDLTTLNVSSNELTRLPESIGNLTALTTLRLYGNQLTSLPESIGNLSALTTLNVIGNSLARLPESIGRLTNLAELALDNNHLVSLPESIGDLTGLKVLKLGGNELTRLPESIGRLTNLAELVLDDNHLVDLPESIGGLRRLTALTLNNNALVGLPESVDGLVSLTTLDMDSNRLRTLPRQLADLLTRGLTIRVAHNPLVDPLPEILGRGADALATYLRSLEDFVVQYEAKLLLVGEGNVGKTSLIAALKDEPFIVDRPTTHGIEISPLTFRHPTNDLEMTLRAWDFGGQEVYRVSHQFFFSRRALYIVVWNPREGQERNEVEDWLRRIRLRVGPNARTMVVATHCDERLPELDYPQLQQEFPGMLVGHFEIDSQSGTGLSQLRQAIAQEAAHLPQMGQQISPRWVAARNDLLARAELEPQIRYDQFTEICTQSDVVGPEITTLAELMHDLGHLIYYGEDEGLKGVIVLNPEWLTKAISYVLEDRRTKDAGGVLAHVRLKSIWQDRKDGTAYPTRYHPYFLRLMEKFDISYRLEDDDEPQSLVAQLVPHERPLLPWEFKTRPPSDVRTLALACRLSEPAPGLVPWLTVRHHRASTGLYWRRGIFLRHPVAAYASEALIELRQPVELTLQVRAPSPDLYFNVLRDSIEDLISRRWPGLIYKLLIPCPSKIPGAQTCPGQFPLEGLLRLREKGHNTYPCIECTQIHNISQLLTGFTTPQLPAQAELGIITSRLANIESGIIRIEGLAAETADVMRRVLRVVSMEVTDCPRLFTLTPAGSTLVERARIHYDRYNLTLWCEHPDSWHAWDPATYELAIPKDWFVKVIPYARLISRILQFAVPLAGSIAVASLPEGQIERAQARLETMNTLIENLPTKADSDEDVGTPTLRNTAGQLTEAEGAALRAFRAVLFEHDRLRTFGGMRRVQAPAGDLLWVCTDHYSEYDPGLPVVP